MDKKVYDRMSETQGMMDELLSEGIFMAAP